MQEQEFWSIVDAAHRVASADTDARVDALEQQLLPLSLSEIQGFQNR